MNVSCVLNQQALWTWTFTPKTSQGITNNQDLIVTGNITTVIGGNVNNNGQVVVSGNSVAIIQGNVNNNANLNISTNATTIIQGNFTQSSSGQLVFSFMPSSQNNNKSVPLNVGGCVSINGNINLNLQTQPQQGTTNLQLISYNCTQPVNISSSQIQVIPNYNGSSCDTINSQTINQQGSLGVSLTSTLGNKCNGGNGKNLGLIIGLSVGIPLLIAAVIFPIAHYFKKRQERYIQSRVREIELAQVSPKRENLTNNRQTN